MGREIRRVPPNWQHPQEEKPDYRRGVMELRYIGMRDKSVQERFDEWQQEYAKWLAGEHDRIIEKYGEKDYPKDEPYRSFCAWGGGPPEPDGYRPDWPEGSATWYQMYETVSEGTPVSPPFETQQELVEYLVANGDFWDQKRRKEGNSSMNCDPWERSSAERFVFGTGWSPSLMVNVGPTGPSIKTAKDGI